MGWLKKIIGAVANFFGFDSRPQSAPAGPSPHEIEALRAQLAEVQRLKQQLEDDRRQTLADNATQNEAIRVREEAIRLREEQAAREEEDQRRREEDARNYPVPQYLKDAGYKGTVNVALVGNSGVGKSLLNNTMRGVRREDASWAAVGVNETTMQPTPYAFPDVPQARMWDLPGAGTQAFPREDYLRTVGLRYFDAVLVVSATRFTQVEVTVLRELREFAVPFFAVRTKLDVDIENNESDNGATAEETKRSISEDLRLRGVDDPYLINTRAALAHDFEKLTRDVQAAVRANRKLGQNGPRPAM